MTKERFVAFIDILGFKKLLKTPGAEKLLSILQPCMRSIKMAHAMDLDVTTTTSINGKTVSKKTKVSPKYFALEELQVFSDSIFLFSKSNTNADLIQIVDFSIIIFERLLRAGIPSRGVLTFGECLIDKELNIFLGKALTHAYLTEQNLDIVGLVIDLDGEISAYKKLPVKAKCGKSHEYYIPSPSPDLFFDINKENAMKEFKKLTEESGDLKHRYENSIEIVDTMLTVPHERVTEKFWIKHPLEE